jgi:hypothetical protein
MEVLSRTSVSNLCVEVQLPGLCWLNLEFLLRVMAPISRSHTCNLSVEAYMVGLSEVSTLTSFVGSRQ